MSGPGRSEDVSDEEILSVFKATDDPVLSTKEVADAIGLSRRATFDRLNRLDDEGKITHKKIDKRRTVWWLNSVDSGDQR